MLPYTFEKLAIIIGLFLGPDCPPEYHPEIIRWIQRYVSIRHNKLSREDRMEILKLFVPKTIIEEEEEN